MVRIINLRQSISKSVTCNFKFPREPCLFMWSLNRGLDGVFKLKGEGIREDERDRIK